MLIRIVKYSLCLILFLIISTSAFAGKITRSCDAQYNVIVTNIDGRAVNESITGHRFSARRGCGSNVPNRCRERARDAAHTCMQRHWDTRWERKTPIECVSEGVKNYRIDDLKESLEARACLSVMPGGGFDPHAVTGIKLRFTTERVTHGHKKCNKRKTIWKDYRVTCSCEVFSRVLQVVDC